MHPIHFVAKKFNFNYLCFHQVKANNLSSFQWKNNLKSNYFLILKYGRFSHLIYFLSASEIWADMIRIIHIWSWQKYIFHMMVARKERERAKNIQDRKKVVIIPCGLYKNRLDVSFATTLCSLHLLSKNCPHDDDIISTISNHKRKMSL